MDLIYHDPTTGALHMRCDAGAQARHMIRESAVTEVHIYDSIAGVMALYGEGGSEPQRDFTAMDLAFLEGLDSLRSIVIHPLEGNPVMGVEALYSLSGCEHLEFQFFNAWRMVDGNVLDLGRMPRLRSFTTVYHDGIVNLEQCSALEELKLRHYPHKDCAPLGKLYSLRSLQLMESAVVSLHGVDALHRLEHVVIGHCRSLTNIDALNGCHRLSSICIERCRALADIELASESLRVCILDKVATLSFLRQCPNLERLSFMNLLDGQMDVIVEQRIPEVFFTSGSRKHYQYSERELRRLVSLR